MISHSQHVGALRRLIRIGLSDYKRHSTDESATAAVEHYRRILREDSARQRRAARKAREAARQAATTGTEAAA